MTKVDFYILPDSDIIQRHHFACRLVEKAYKLGHSIYIHSDDDAQANALDQLLWSFRDSSFIPHSVIDAGDPENGKNDAVHIGYSDQNIVDSKPLEAGVGSLLVNLSTAVPECFSRFDRVSEIVVQDPQVQQATRANFRFYRDRGYELQTHDLRK